MLACETAVETTTALTIQRTIERAAGEPCPCKIGRECPMRFELGINSPRDDLVAIEPPAA